MENLKDKLKKTAAQVGLYTVILVSLGTGVSIGYYYNMIKSSFKINKPVSVKKLTLFLYDSNILNVAIFDNSIPFSSKIVLKSDNKSTDDLSLMC